jgi:DegV family protein with EDD domain
MSAVQIVTDSACDLGDDEVAKHGITVVPLSIRFGADEFVDREELSVEDFYKRMADSDALPETAAPAPGAFEQAFRQAAANGASAVVCINLSSALSATMQSAVNAAQAMGDDLDVRVIDSRSIAGGLGTQVLLAAEAAAAGKSADEIEAMVLDLADRTEIYAALDTLENLKKGGRVGGAKALVGSILSVKPVIHIENGAVEEAAKPRTRRKALEWLRDKLYAEGAVEHLVVCHGEAPDLDVFLDLIADRYPRDQVRVAKIGAVIGTHGGPRVLGVCYVK